MLVNFTVKNYRSFKEERTFSMEASSIKEHEEAVIKSGYHRLLPLTIIYGAVMTLISPLGLTKPLL